MENFIILFALLSFIAALILAFLLSKSKMHLNFLQKINQKLEFEKEQALKELKAEFFAQKEALKQEFQGSYSNLEQKYKNALNELKKKFEDNLQSQNKHFLNQNQNLLSNEGKKLLNEIFEPVKKSVKEYNEKLLLNEVRLQENIKNMFEYSQNIGQKAEKLAQILKGDKKVRGNFAELQLKNILENSGLIEGEQYKLQEHFKEENQSYIPDAVVYFDKEKSLIIDSKFSLPSSFDFNTSDTILCEELALNLKNRIDELAKKPYVHFDTFTYDYVLLFIPYQNILDLALQAAPNLYQEAYKKGIYLTTPHTLFMALNTINIAWRHIKSDENIQKAFEELGKFYDKFSAFVDDFESIKRSFESLGKKIEQGENKLKTGSGNLSSRVAKLKNLGAKTQKQLQLIKDKE